MDDVECTDIHQQNASGKCAFYKETTDCHDADGKLDYMYFIFCYFEYHHSWIAILLCVFWLILLFVGLAVTADDFLCPSLVVITKTLHLSQNIAGVTFLAFGNGAPDIFSSLAGIEQSRPELVIGTLFGAGLFVTSAVAGSIIVSKPFKIMERPFLRDIIFYMCATFWAFLRFYYEELTLLHSIGFIVLYILYIIVVIVSRIVYNRYRKKNAVPAPTIEIQSPTESQNGNSSLESNRRLSFEPSGSLSVEPSGNLSFQPTGKDDDPEAEGVVLRRFSFRGSISTTKRRLSSLHSHHDHIIKTLTQSVESRPNPAFKNGDAPHTRTFDSQISKNSLSSLLSDFDELKQQKCKELFLHLCPVDIMGWPERSILSRLVDIAKAPVCFLLILTVPVVDYENEKNNWCRLLNVLHCIMAPMFVFTVVGDYHSTIGGRVPIWVAVLAPAFLLALLVLWRSTFEEPPFYHWAFGYLGFITSVIWVYLIASEIVSLLKAIGVVFKLSDAILGLTVLAWGNSIGDFISNLSVARQGFPRMGISACYGGPLLNLLLGIGIPYTLMIVKLGHPLQLSYKRLISLLYTTLCIVLISTIIIMTFLRFTAKRYFGIYLLVVYFLFIIAAILLEIGVI